MAMDKSTLLLLLFVLLPLLNLEVAGLEGVDNTCLVVATSSSAVEGLRLLFFFFEVFLGGASASAYIEVIQ